jgi:hypothetical protein
MTLSQSARSWNGIVDKVEVAIIPVLLGGGIALLPPPAGQAELMMIRHKVKKTGIVSLEYIRK